MDKNEINDYITTLEIYCFLSILKNVFIYGTYIILFSGVILFWC